MIVSVLQDQLVRGLNIVGKAVPGKPTLPVLANVLLVAEGGRLKLVATNLEITVATYIGAKVTRDGAITMPAKTFAELVGTLSPERVDLALDEATQTLNIRCGMTNTNIRGVPASEYPPTPEVAEPDVVLPAPFLREIIQQTIFSAAKESNRPILTGLLMRFEDKVLTVAGADGYRMAIRTAPLETGFKKPVSVVVPAPALAEVARIFNDDKATIGVVLPGKRDLIQFATDNTVITAQVLEGKFPDFAALIPKAYSTAVNVYTNDLLRACKRAEIFARDSNFSTRFIVKPPQGPSEPGEVVIKGKSAERGDNEGTLDASVEGDSLDVAFNVRYLMDALHAIPTDRVVLESNGAAHPGVIRPEEGNNFVIIVMPMSVNK